MSELPISHDIRKDFEWEMKVVFPKLQISNIDFETHIQTIYYTNEDNDILFHILEKYNLYYAQTAMTPWGDSANITWEASP